MSEKLEDAIELQQKARSLRKKGDALLKSGRNELASRAFLEGLDKLECSLKVLKPIDVSLRSANVTIEAKNEPELYELIEIYGAVGGLHQRLNDVTRALASYQNGAELEEKYDLASTYNRLNALKCTLLSTSASLSSMMPKIATLAQLINQKLSTDRTMSDQGWAWADLGDCLALLGRTTEASNAYSTFIAKSEIKSPERTLDVLKKISLELEAKGDPGVQALSSAIEVLRVSFEE